MSFVEIGPDLGIEACSELRERLLPHLTTSPIVNLTAATVSRIHSAGIQVIYAFVRDRSDAGLQTRFEQCAAPLQEAAQLLGLSHALGLDRNPAE